MNDRSVPGAIEAIEKIKSIAKLTSGDFPEPVLEALELLADTVDRLAARTAELERNLSSQQAILDDRVLGLERSRFLTAWRHLAARYQAVVRRARGFAPQGELDRRDKEARRTEYRKWMIHDEAGQPGLEAAQRIAAGWARLPVISVVTASHEGSSISESAESVTRQTYPNWQLCIGIDEAEGSRGHSAMRALERDPRVRHVVAPGATALAAALGVATGDYIAILERNALLSPLALYWIVEALQASEHALIYSDEDFLDPELGRVDPLFKPDWSPELLDADGYPGNLLVHKRDGFDIPKGAFDSIDYRRAVAVAAKEQSLRVHHIPRILYHSRTSGPGKGGNQVRERRKVSVGSATNSQPGQNMTAVVCSRSANLLERCLMSIRATAEDTIRQVVVVAHEESGPNPRLRSVIERNNAILVPYSAGFNFSRMNNLAAERATEPNLLFLNDDVYATSKGWARMLADLVTCERIGIAGAVLWYPGGVLQHAGITVGIGDGVGHTGRYLKPTPLWPWLLMTRNVSAVTGACFAIRRSVFRRISGFDPDFPNNFNDVDLCFRARREGFEVVCVSAPGLIHDECRSRPGIVRFQERYAFYRRWAALLSRPDPYYSTSLAPTERIALNLEDDDWYRPLLTTPDGAEGDANALT